MPWERRLQSGHSGWPNANGPPLSSPPPTSLSSSYPSPTAPQMLAKDSSLSNVHSPDHTAPPPTHPHVRNLVTTPSRPRSSSLAVMGQNLSRSASPSSNPASASSQLHKGIAAATATGIKLKRALGGRRKNKSEDATKLFKSIDREYYTDSDLAPAASSSKELAHHVFSGRRSSDKIARSPSPLATPPPPPPKPLGMQGSKGPAPAALQIHHNHPEARSSIIAVSPGISSALNFMRMDDMERQKSETQRLEQEKAQAEKEVWRKSDSNMSHHTIRAGATTTTRTSRPVSMAESLQSIHTIVPVNKRLSALLTDAEYVMPEEDLTTPTDITPPPKSSPSSSLRARNRRSMSLNIGPTVATIRIPPSAATATIVTDSKYPSRSFDDVHPRISPSVSRETPTLTRAAASGIISPSSAGLQSTGNNIRGRLAAWTATTNTNPSQSSLPSPPLGPMRYSPTPPPCPSSSSRQPTISMTGGFGLAKRAVEKMNRAWGGFSSSSSNSGHSSSNSSTAPSSYSDNNLTRTSSNQSVGFGRGSKKSRRAPDAAWSVSSSSSSASDSEFPKPAAPYLGKQLRGPMRIRNGGAVGGIVFGRDLKSVTLETAIGVGVDFSATDIERILGPERAGNVDKQHLEMLEKRMLPAIVVRCAQHLLIWGIQEEGLFRVSGRPSHVSKLRNEFDTGADFDMAECSPGDLDPHAVASVFKAYLRELPEPILTNNLLPYFEAALTQENVTNAQEKPQTGNRAAKGPTLPAGPKSGFQSLRKPPSLSTLAMPSFTGMRPPSRSLINALKSLMSQLPPENKDLIRTVTELIKATAEDRSATKMPLSNLLLVFCPSLNMNPPLLKVLCEAEGIWDRAPDTPVLDIKRESVVLDISAPTSAKLSATPSQDDERNPKRPSIDSHNSSGSGEGAGAIPRTRPLGPRRNVAAAVYAGSGDQVDELGSRLRSVSSHSAESKSTLDDVSSYDSRSEGHSLSSRPNISSPPPLSSSSESLVTPESASANASLTHIPFVNDPYTKSEPSIVPSIACTSDLAIGDGQISEPIHFPTMEDSESPLRTLSPRRSIPFLSGHSSNPPSPSHSAPSSPRHRMKRPSLNLLFSKRSASPLTSSPSGRPHISSPYLQPHSASDSSISTPVSAVTAPQSQSPSVPPVLDTAIESSPLRLDMGLEPSPPIRNKEHQPSLQLSNAEVLTDVPSISARPGVTPIADRYRSSSNATIPETSVEVLSPSHLRPNPTRNFSKSSTASSNHLGVMVEDEDREDWTQSVLMAADVDASKWSFSTTK